MRLNRAHYGRCNIHLATIAEAAHRSPQRPLDAIFIPRNIAVIGATEAPGSVGRTLLWNLISSPFGGTVFPINPKALERSWNQGISEHQQRPGKSGSCSCGHTRAHRAIDHGSVC